MALSNHFGSSIMALLALCSNTLPTMAQSGLRPAEVITAFPASNGDSVFLDGAQALAVSGNRFAILHPGEGKIVVGALVPLSARALGRGGFGPGDIPPTATGIAINRSGLLVITEPMRRQIILLDSVGSELQRWQLGLPLYRPKPVDIDSEGKIIVATEAPDGRRILFFRLTRGIALPQPIGESETAPPVVRVTDKGKQILHPPSRYLYPPQWMGRLYWDVSPNGTLHVAHAHDYIVDVHTGTGWSRRWQQPKGQYARVSKRELEAAAGRTKANGIGANAESLDPAYHALVHGLFVMDRDVAVLLRRNGKIILTSVDRSFADISVDFDVSAVSEVAIVGWTEGEDGVQALVIAPLRTKSASRPIQQQSSPSCITRDAKRRGIDIYASGASIPRNRISVEYKQSRATVAVMSSDGIKLTCRGAGLIEFRGLSGKDSIQLNIEAPKRLPVRIFNSSGRLADTIH